LQKRESPALRAVELIVFALLQASLQRSKTTSSGFAGLSLFLSGRLNAPMFYKNFWLKELQEILSSIHLFAHQVCKELAAIEISQN